MEVKILNAGKLCAQDILPVLFIPLSCKKLIRTVDDAFAAFLQPLIAELEYLFVEGVDLYYNYPPSQIISQSYTISEKCRLRTILMMVTGDHPAQCKIGLFKSGGQAFCRRDKARATLDGRINGYSGRYVFDGNRYQARYPATKRSTCEMVDALSKHNKTHIQYEREEILRGAGLSGESILWRLYALYSFDLAIDLVYDAMHILSLNLFRKYISSLMKECTHESSKAIDAIVTEVFKKAPSSIRYGRWPHLPSKYHSIFKAEENQKFIQWCLPNILGNVVGISKCSYELGLLLIDIAHIFYNYSRDKGWSKEGLIVARSLLLAWRVRSEEYHGPNSSPLEHVAGWNHYKPSTFLYSLFIALALPIYLVLVYVGNGEILDDVYRHGSHDVYWCYDFERKVSTYVNISTNNKSNEISYSQFFRRKVFISTFESIQMDKDGLLPPRRMLGHFHAFLVLPDGYALQTDHSLECFPFHRRGIFEVSSISKAKEIWKTYLAHKCGYPCEEIMLTKGIAITKKRKQWRAPTEEEIQYAEHFWQIERGHGYFEQITIYNKVLFGGEIYAIGDHVVVRTDDTNEENNVGHWKAQVASFFAMQKNGEFMIFFGANYFRQCIVVADDKEHLKIDDTTGMSILQKTFVSYNWDCIRPITSLLHKFIPISHGSECIAYETKDLSIRKKLLAYGSPGCVPPWLEEHDIVIIQIDPKHLRHAVVRNVDIENRLVKVDWIRKMNNHCEMWRVDQGEETYVHWDKCVTFLENWHVVRSRRLEIDGTLKQVPIAWYSES